MGTVKPEDDLKQDLNDSGCVQDDSMDGYRGQAALLDLSDDVLLYLLGFCSPMDLKALGHTCTRLARLMCDRTLWQRVDARDFPMGSERLRWFLRHCLSAATTELLLTGYANRDSRCLGIQDLSWSSDHEGLPRPRNPDNSDGVDVEHFLLRMWYPHLPRYAVSPRWPDREEVATHMRVHNYLKNGVLSRTPTKELEPPPQTNALEAPPQNYEAPAQNDGAPAQGEEVSRAHGAVVPPAQGDHENMDVNGNDANPMDQDDNRLKFIDLSQGPVKRLETGVYLNRRGPPDQNPGPSADQGGPGPSGDQGGPGPSTDQGGPGPSGDQGGPGPSQDRGPSGPKPVPLGFRTVQQLRDAEHPDNCFGPYFTFNDNLMKALSKKCSQLTSLFLEYCNIDYKVTNIRVFPPKLKKLSLRGTRCFNLPLNMSYLCKIQDQLPLLEYLDVSECEWFEPASLMPLSKLPVLKELYMKDCVRLTECVAYASLATRYGFRQLRVLDVRGSPISDSEISAVGWLPLLEELYCAPGDDFRTLSEHTHAWSERLEPYQELTGWEAEEPEYFRNRTPEPEAAEEEEVRAPEPAPDDNAERPWWSHERRIIVIQPSAELIDENPATVRLRALGLQVEPGPIAGPSNPAPAAPGPAAPAPAAPGPSGTKRPNSDSVLDLVKRPRLAKDEEDEAENEEEAENQENDRPVITAQDCPRIQRVQVLNRPILIGRQQPLNRPDALLPSDLFRHCTVSRLNYRPDVAPAAGEEPQDKPQKEPQAGSSQAGDPEVKVNDEKLQDEQPQAGPSKEPSNSRWVNAAVKLAPNYVNRTVRDLNVTVHVAPNGNLPPNSNPPPSRNAQLIPVPPAPRHVHFVNPQRPFVNNIPHNLDPPQFLRVNGRPDLADPQAVAANEVRGVPHLYAPYANGPQAVIIPGNMAPINAGPQAHLLMPHNRVRNAPPYGNQIPYGPPYHSIPAHRNRQVPEELLQNDGELIQDIVNEFDGNARNDVIRPRFVRFRSNSMRDRMHVDLDIHHHQQVHQSNAHLVTDSAILRFGRADNDDINYIHIARVGDPVNEQSNRPDRSNLRILSVTGYRNITNRSLQHLATAAPHLRWIDFSGTSVTQNGVNVFKAIRPNCEVIFSEYARRI